jgi:hypothetical protein
VKGKKRDRNILTDYKDSDKKKNEILSFVGKWMELENIILSEVNHAKSCMFSFICGI